MSFGQTDILTAQDARPPTQGGQAMFPAIPSVIAKSGNLTDRGIDRVDRADAMEVGIAEREPSQASISQAREDASESSIQLLSTDSSVGTLLDVVA